MAEQGKGEGGKGNAQISTQYGGKDAPIEKMGQTEGSRYGMNPHKKTSGKKK